MVKKKDLDWGQPEVRLPSRPTTATTLNWKDGEWDEGGLDRRPRPPPFRVRRHFPLLPGGLRGPVKAYTTEEGSIVLLYRPDINAEPHVRLHPLKRLEMPGFPQGALRRGREAGCEGERRVGAAVWLRRHAVRAPVHDRLRRGHRRGSRTRVHSSASWSPPSARTSRAA